MLEGGSLRLPPYRHRFSMRTWHFKEATAHGCHQVAFHREAIGLTTLISSTGPNALLDLGQFRGKRSMRIGRRRLLKSALVTPFFLASGMATLRAQTEYPNRPIRLIVGFGPGGGTDILARLVAAKLSEILSQSIVVENRPGASARLAAEYVANQPGDGYTLLASPIGPMSMAAAIFSDLKYDPIKSFVPLAMIGQFPEISGRTIRYPGQNRQRIGRVRKATSR